MTSASSLTRFLLITVFFLGPNPELRIPGVNIFFVDFAILAFICVTLLSVKSYKVSLPLIVSVSLVIFGYSLGSIRSYDPDLHFSGLIQYLFVFLFLLAVNMNVDDHGLSMRCLKAFMYGSFLAIIISLASLNGLLPVVWFKHLTGYRFGGVWENPNLLMKQLSFAILCGLIIIFNNRSFTYFDRLISIISGFLSLYLGLFAASFGGIASYTLAFGLSTFDSFRRSSPMGKLVIISLLFCFVAGVAAYTVHSGVPEAFERRVTSVSSIDDAGSATDKISQFITGSLIFITQPLIGVGVENGRFLNTDRMTALSNHISFHSFYITAALEGGILSVIGYLILFAFMIRNGRRLPLGRFAIPLSALFLFNLLVHTNIYTRMYWIPISILLLSSAIKNVDRRTTRPNDGST